MKDKNSNSRLSNHKVGRPKGSKTKKQNAVSSTVSGLKEQEQKPDSEVSASAPAIMKCPFCSQSFNNEKIWTAHQRYCANKPKETASVSGLGETVSVPDARESDRAPEVSKTPVSLKKVRMSQEVLEIAVAQSFDLAAEKWGEYWRFSTQEAHQFAEIWKPVLDDIMPKLFNSPFKMAFGTSVLMLWPRIQRKLYANAGKRGEGSTLDNRNIGQRENDFAKAAVEEGIAGLGV